MSEAASEFCEVRIMGLPLAVQVLAHEQHDELMREFALLELAGPTADERHVPRRLRELMSALLQQYGAVGAAPEAEREAARARGDVTVDLVYRTPVAVGAACTALSTLLDEADEFCRSGAQLLTLAALPELVAYRHWYLGEFAAQCRGEQPTAWAAYAGSHGVVVPGQRELGQL